MNMGKLTDEDWEWIEKKYGSLLHHIAYRVGGDPITYDHDDSYQELVIAVLDTVRTFDSTTGQKFQEYKDSKHFDKYLKTVLWNRKNNMGSKIVKREPLRRQVTIDDDLLADKVHLPCESFVPFGNEDFTEAERTMIDEILHDPKIVKPNGKFNISRVCRNLDITKNDAKRLINRLQHKLEKWLDY